MRCPRCDRPAPDETLRQCARVCPACLAAFAGEAPEPPRLPNLEILEPLGEGGMGVVYKARQTTLDRIVALKVLSPALAEDPDFLNRFRREPRALAQLSHPGIVAVHEAGVHDAVPYLVMECVDGPSLRSLMRSGKLDPERALAVVRQICEALEYAHARGVVHRDLKPENVLVDRAGRVKIADFGLAKLAGPDVTRVTRSDVRLGTPAYMAPEQLERSARVDHRADLYALGVTLYEMLTGELPIGRFPPPSEKAAVDRRLDPPVLKALEKDPDRRFQTATEMGEQIMRLEGGAPLPAAPPQCGIQSLPGRPARPSGWPP